MLARVLGPRCGKRRSAERRLPSYQVIVDAHLEHEHHVLKHGVSGFMRAFRKADLPHGHRCPNFDAADMTFSPAVLLRRVPFLPTQGR